jgi:hypothetical protein
MLAVHKFALSRSVAVAEFDQLAFCATINPTKELLVVHCKVKNWASGQAAGTTRSIASSHKYERSLGQIEE